MKYVLFFIVLISLVICEPSPIGKILPAEEVFINVKKSILECISKDLTATEELRKYAQDNLDGGCKETLSFSKYRQNETDNNVIRQCRRKAFINSYRTKKPYLTLSNNEKPKYK